MKPPKLTAVVIAKNEEEMIGECLDALGFADTIIVVDNNSTDETKSIAEKKGATVIEADTDNFSELREVALKKISNGFVLYIDADERITPKLQEEIQHAIFNESSFAAYRIPRRNYYLGNHPWPDIEHLERLFKRSELKGWKGELHETAVVDGEIGDLTEPLLHYTHREFSSMVKKTNHWSETEAKLRFDAGHPSITWWRFPRVMLQAFMNSYFTQKGWKVGTVGILESLYQAFSIFITYAKLWELQQNSKKK